MKKSSSIAIAFAVVLGLGAGLAQAGAPKRNSDIRIGFAGMTLNNEFHITLANGAKAKARELGVNIDVQAGDQHASAAAQLVIIENFLSNAVDGLIIVPSASEGLETALRKSKEQGVPVVNADTLINRDVAASAGLPNIPFYGTNNFEGAKLAGQFVAGKFPKGTKTAILTGIEGHQNAADRRNGFIEGAGDAIQVVAEQTANWEVDQGYTAAQNIISANPDLELVFASNDNMGIGALRAIQEAGLKDRIGIVGFDAVSEALNLVESGEFLCTVAQFPSKMGEIAVENLVKAIKGEPYADYVDTGCRVITKDNVQEHKDYLSQYVD
ncbi:MAG: sugar ABC transporter substrate-binding protein [Planctomycetota bacterium]|jgi:ribose transport system substrate-binding protein|nr:sugar ABC transporter substrate-binding protein [Planctomycetota bacterium]